MLPFFTREGQEDKMGYPTQIFWDSKNRLWAGQLDGSVLLCEDLQKAAVKLDIPNTTKTPQMVFAEDQYQQVWVVVSVNSKKPPSRKPRLLIQKKESNLLFPCCEELHYYQGAPD